MLMKNIINKECINNSVSINSANYLYTHAHVNVLTLAYMCTSLLTQYVFNVYGGSVISIQLTPANKYDI